MYKINSITRFNSNHHQHEIQVSEVIRIEIRNLTNLLQSN